MIDFTLNNKKILEKYLTRLIFILFYIFSLVFLVQVVTLSIQPQSYLFIGRDYSCHGRSELN